MAEKTKPFVSPINNADRIISLDVLRGFAVLGILIMNIQSFAMPAATYINPSAYGNLQDYNLWIWIVSHIIASEKFMSIFSILFGAGILLFADKVAAGNGKPWPLHFRRMFWLFVFGMLHAYLLWYGDILVAYSICGLLAFTFRKKKPASLLRISFLFFLVPILFYTMSYLSLPLWPDESYQQVLKSWKPDMDYIRGEISAMKGSWLSQMEYRVPGAVFLQTQLFLMETFWRVMSMMLLGMALYKWKILSAEMSRKTYFTMAAIGVLFGYFISATGVLLNFENEWALRFSMFLGRHFNYIGSILAAIGYIGILMIISKSFHLLYIKYTLAVVGRMAFSNYFLQTLICVFIFYGFGLAKFGNSGRIAQSVMVVAIWIIILLFSFLWLRVFHFGPLEWTWKSLTYWKIQPMMRKKVES